ncbi:MAG TPA: response regulator transcription factor [Nocardioides sp.]|uniref:response regulator transcription factor n=1 Tax=Nocardioides sp. TaxID=35761 RepID=UPI002F4242D6
MIRVLIVDDQDLVRMGFRLILEREPDLTVVGEAGDGAAAVSQSGRLHPDVVLMDIRMPVLDGIEATRRVTATSSGPKVLILTTFDLDELVYAGLEAGASGFLLKDVKAEVLAEAIRTVHAGEALLAPTVTRRLITTFLATHRRPDVDWSDLESLTPREREVLRLIAGGLSNAEIADELVLSQATVKTHVGRVFAKIGARDRAQAVVYAYERGVVSSTGR